MSGEGALSGPVVVGYDGGAAAAAAVRWAAREASRRGCALHVVLAHDGQDDHLPVEGPEAATLAGVAASTRTTTAVIAHDVAARRSLVAAAGRVLVDRGADCARDVAPDLPVETFVEFAPPAAVLVGCSLDAAMVVVGASDRGRVAGELGGSVVLAVAAHAHCPVTVVHGDVEALREVSLPVVVGVDGSPSSEVALVHAADTAHALGVPLRVVVAWWVRTSEHLESLLRAGYPPENAGMTAEHLLAAALAAARDRQPGLEVTGESVERRPARALVAISARAERLVLGTRGRGGFAALLLGSVTHTVIREAYCPVTIAR
ncbi:universal stress protein [Oerskovia flava]|uniref:universal stress protein n=1 Tax=Oerskovia flava TaxID=2986422 RepID=UPI00223ECC28|nr:universal stress protein [Oerskovia sp. JB1-3-2]